MNSRARQELLSNLGAASFDMEAGAVSVRLHHGGPQGANPKGEVVADLFRAIRERRA